MSKYNPKYIEPKWLKYWEENPDLCKAENDSEKEKKYNLVMFPYPSGDGLHVGHVESYTATDIVSRYDRMTGKNVMQPYGWDAFGLPAENFAIKTGTHPSITTQKAIKNFKRQVKMTGMSYDWSREIDTSSSEYYKWTQWFFLLLYKNGLAYKSKAKVNWCESCKTVLANEQVEDGKCERCKNLVIQKDLEQWFFKITDFIEDRGNTSGLISGLDKIDWPESTKQAQKNWIGRSEGTVVKFKIQNAKLKIATQNSKLEESFIDVFTTRVDTILGCTYVVLAPEHKLASELRGKIENYEELERYLEEAKKKSDLDRMEAKVKTGVELKGISAINPFNNEAVPVFVADYVLSQYGTGAVMAVPAHDERDFEFAKKYNLPIKQSIAPLYIAEGKDKIRDDKPNTERKVVDVIIKHWKEDKFFCLDWKNNNWKSFVVGGIEEGETLEEAAIREAQEESGYKNMRVVRQIGGEMHSRFFAAHKDVNRKDLIRNCILIELIDGEYAEPEEKHVENHVGIWIEKDKVAAYLNLTALKVYWDIFLNGQKAFTDDGILVNFGEYDGLTSQEAREKMSEWLEKNNLGKRQINYRLRDWLVSRQRYWGAPIPIIYCEKCGTVPVPEDQLPVKLPDDVDFKPTGESPLKYSKKFHDVKCPACGGNALRESDTMDTFVCSSWYYFRYSDPKNDKEFASQDSIKKWLPIDLYVGGAEHTVLHLLYARFFTKVLHNLGMIDFDEPFKRMRHQGLIMAEDGRKMSKSLGNVVNPDEEVEHYGADSLRLFEMFMGPLEDSKPWNTKGIVGVYRFLEKVWKLKSKVKSQKSKVQVKSQKLDNLVHKTIKKVGEDIENFRFNTAISSLMILTNELDKEEFISIANYQLLITLLSPFAPFISEELWNQLGHTESIFREKWPQYDPELIKDEEIELVIQVNGKVRDRMMVSAGITEKKAKALVENSEKIKTYISGKEVKKIVFVKGRLINIVI